MENTSCSIRSEDLFFFLRHDDFGKEKGNTRSKTFFLQNTNFWESWPRAFNFEYPSLNTSIIMRCDNN